MCSLYLDFHFRGVCMKKTVDIISIVVQHLRHQSLEQLSPGLGPGMLRAAGWKYFQPCHMGLSSSITRLHSHGDLPADQGVQPVLKVHV